MPYEYRAEPFPASATPAEDLQRRINEQAAKGWDYYRAESVLAKLPIGPRGKAPPEASDLQYVTVLLFRRETGERLQTPRASAVRRSTRTTPRPPGSRTLDILETSGGMLSNTYRVIAEARNTGKVRLDNVRINVAFFDRDNVLIAELPGDGTKELPAGGTARYVAVYSGRELRNIGRFEVGGFGMPLPT